MKCMYALEMERKEKKKRTPLAKLPLPPVFPLPIELPAIVPKLLPVRCPKLLEYFLPANPAGRSSPVLTVGLIESAVPPVILPLDKLWLELSELGKGG